MGLSTSLTPPIDPDTHNPPIRYMSCEGKLPRPRGLLHQILATRPVRVNPRSIQVAGRLPIMQLPRAYLARIDVRLRVGGNNESHVCLPGVTTGDGHFRRCSTAARH